MASVQRSGGKINAYAAMGTAQRLEPYDYVPNDIGPNDIEVTVSHCGVCHTDLHLTNNDWGISSYPFVPGHEIIGHVSQLGSDAHRLKVGQRVGVGWLAGACFACEQCTSGHDNLCVNGQPTCVGREGGYGAHVRVDSRFAFPIPEGLSSEAAAPLFCAGITVFNPLIRHVRANTRLGVIGIGGLGHLALQYGRALGCHVTAFSASPGKANEAKRLGADDFVNTAAPGALKAYASTCDFLLSTGTADIPWNDYVSVLRPGGKLCIVGVPSGDVRITAFPFILGQKSLVSSVVGSRAEIHDMLEFSARHKIAPQVEVYPMKDVNSVFERLAANQVRYRAVLTNKH